MDFRIDMELEVFPGVVVKRYGEYYHHHTDESQDKWAEEQMDYLYYLCIRHLEAVTAKLLDFLLSRKESNLGRAAKADHILPLERRKYG